MHVHVQVHPYLYNTTSSSHLRPFTDFLTDKVLLPLSSTSHRMANIPSPKTVLPHCPQYFASFLAPYLNQDLNSDQAQKRKISTYIQCIWNGRWGRRHPLYHCASISHCKHIAFLRLGLLCLPLGAYPQAPNSQPFTSRMCDLHKHISGSLPCSAVGDLQHTLRHCAHVRKHMRSLHQTYHPTSIEAFFNNQDIPTLATQSSSLLSFISK